SSAPAARGGGRAPGGRWGPRSRRKHPGRRRAPAAGACKAAGTARARTLRSPPRRPPSSLPGSRLQPLARRWDPGCSSRTGHRGRRRTPPARAGARSCSRRKPERARCRRSPPRRRRSVSGLGKRKPSAPNCGWQDPVPHQGLKGPSCRTHPDFADLAFVDGDVDAEGRHGDAPHKGHGRAAPVLILGGDGEGGQALGADPWAASGCQHIVAGALEVEVPAIEGVVVRVAPQPARGLVVGHAHALAVFHLACLLWPTRHTMARVWRQGERTSWGCPGSALEGLPQARTDTRGLPSETQPLQFAVSEARPWGSPVLEIQALWQTVSKTSSRLPHPRLCSLLSETHTPST
uniref:Uncharacterized protein n=1 Tax=Suricata suricatta TaxID=37032 RepID=A0A673V358_SURSU